jgi:hypothetical protein
VAVSASDIKFKSSINTGPGNSTAQADLADSTGGFMSSTVLTDATLHNLFDAITATENAASQVDYRCIFVHNANATDSLTNTKVWLASEVSGGASIAIALDGTGVVDYNAAGAQAEREANTTTAPTGETFSSPTTKSTGLSIGTLAANKAIAIWVRRTAANTSALSNDGVSIRVEGDTA